jgi:Tfp pilus assembly protein PilX
MRRLRNEAGVALITVLFIGAVMTVTVSTAAFVAVGEFRAANDDRGSSSALAYAEAGVDRTILWIRSNRAVWRQIVLSGCGTVAGTVYNPIRLQGQVNNGHYNATISRADNCSPVPTTIPPPQEAQQMVITSEGCTDGTAGAACPTGAARRVVRQAIRVGTRPLPIGMSSNRVDSQGSPSLIGLTVFARGIVNTRSQIDVSGTDPWYEKEDFYPCTGGAVPPACFPEDGDNVGDMPAAVHSTDRIFLRPNGTNEHPPSPNCAEPDFIWDGSATGGASTALSTACPDYPLSPPTSLFTDADHDRLASTPRLTEEDHHFFKSIAQQQGLYCSNYGSAAQTCSKAGVTPVAGVAGDIDQLDVAGLGQNFVVYIEYPAGDPLSRQLGWNVTNPVPTDVCTANPPVANTMVVLIVRGAGVETKTNFMGAIFAEDGNFSTAGNLRFEGSLAANVIRTRGTPTLCMTNRWLQSMPGVFLEVTALRWSEVDR